MIVSKTMTRKVITFNGKESLRAAHKAMCDLSIRHIPIVDNNVLIGIISDKDLLLDANVSNNNELLFSNKKVFEIMTKNIIYCFQDTSISEAASLLIDYKIDCLPVVNRTKKLIGLVTSTDILSLLKELNPSKLAHPLPYQFELMKFEHGELCA